MLSTLRKVALTVLGLSLSLMMTLVMAARLAFQAIKNPRGIFYVKPRPDPPKCLVDGWNHGHLNLPNIRLHYVFGGERSKPLMLLLHGFPEFWYTWRHQIKEFCSDYRVVALDMRGYGDSDKPEGIMNYKIDNLVNDVKETIAALGYSSCNLVAHDWGGAVAWQVVIRYPELIDKFIVCNCPHPVAMRKFLSSKPQQMMKSWYMFFFQLPRLPEIWMRSFDMHGFDELFTNPAAGGCKNPNAFTAEDLEAWKYTFGKPGAFTPPVNYYRAAFASGRLAHSRQDKEGQVNKIKPPTLIIWGTEDVALETGMASLSCDQCENGSVKYVDGASHWVQNDEPKVVNNFMWKFLKGETTHL